MSDFTPLFSANFSFIYLSIICLICHCPSNCCLSSCLSIHIVVRLTQNTVAAEQLNPFLLYSCKYLHFWNKSDIELSYINVIFWQWCTVHSNWICTSQNQSNHLSLMQNIVTNLSFQWHIALKISLECHSVGIFFWYCLMYSAVLWINKDMRNTHILDFISRHTV